jgi:hypothetical protein
MSWSTTGAAVDTAKTPTSVILFSRSGQTTIRQTEVAETSQTRGLTKAAALALAGVVDTSVEEVYYKHIDGRTYSFTAKVSGTRTTKTASRANEADGWTVTTETVTYSVSPSPTQNGWTTTRLDEDGNAATLTSSGTSRVLSYDRATSHVVWDVYSVVSTTTTEVRNIDTQAHAEAIVNANQGDAVQNGMIQYWQQLNTSSSPGAQAQWMVTAWAYLPLGTQKSASARYVSAEDGWSVTIVTKVYDWDSPNKTTSSSGTGWYAGNDHTTTV